MASDTDFLVVAATRPAMKWGVTLEGLIIGGGLVGVFFIGTGNPLALLLYVPIHGVMYLLCLRDPRTFRLIFLWVGTKMRSLGWRHWGASTATPLVNTRATRRMPK